jgi:glycine/D-amino acid oxidase-like deaminating enzyme/nitrite reductase/ring-hydroxylating ferredoxin subunit
MTPDSSGTSVSVWMDTYHVPDFPPLKEDIETDICIVGGGIAGITTAYLLAKAGAKVVLLEKGPILRGETERTTAHLTNAIDDRFMEIERIHGIDFSKLAGQSHAEAIDFIEHTVQKEAIDCAFRRLDGYLFLGKNQKESFLDEELAAVHRAGLLTVEKLPHLSAGEKDFGPCLRFPKQGQFHPTKYLSALAQAAVRHGANIFTESSVDDIREHSLPVQVRVAAGHTVTAQKLIVATNAPINDNIAIYSKQAPYRTFVIGLRVPENAVPTALYWDTEDPYHYIRHADKDVLIVGGEDHKTGQEDDMDARLQRLEKWARDHFPSAGDVLYHWSGQVFETIDGLAMIGRKPMGKEWSFIATGDSGMGMTHGTIAGLLLSELVQGNDHPWKELYDPARMRLKAGMTFLKDGTNVGMQVVEDWIRPSEVKKPEQIPHGSGAVMRDGMTKIALYRDDKGEFHACNAVCPHKGCVVQWNDGEKSWDCPCHGSRYDSSGAVLTGPTRANLKPLPDWKPDEHS